MNNGARSSDSWSIDDLEIELRMLPGVCAAGFDDSDDTLFVQLHVAEEAARADGAAASTPLPVSASRIAARHADRPVAVEVVRWRAVAPPAVAGDEIEPAEPAPELTEPAFEDTEFRVEERTLPSVSRRARLLAVLAFPDTDELEVHLVLDGKRTIGRAAASEGIEGAAVATLEAVRDLGTGIDARLVWARRVEDAGPDDRVIVAVALEGIDPRASVNYGVAGGASPIDAASRATLDALDRRMSRLT